MPFLHRSVRFSSSSSTNNTTSKEDEYEKGYKLVSDNQVDNIILESLHSSKDPQQKTISIAASITKQMAVKITWNINQRRIDRVNQTRVDLRGTKAGNRTKKLDSWNLAKRWGIGIKQPKKTIMDTTQNSV